MSVHRTHSRRSLVRFSLMGLVAAPLLQACAAATPTATAPPAKPAAAAPAASGAQSAPTQASAPPKSAAPVELRLHTVQREPHSGWIQTAYDTDVDGWKSKHPNVTLKIEAVPGFLPEYTPKVLALASANQLGDIVWFAARHRSSIAWGTRYNMVRDLNPLVKSTNYDLKQFFPGAIEPSTYEGKFFWLNYIGEPCAPLIAYNATKVQQMGLPPLTDDMTFDELAAWAQKGTKDGVFGYFRNASYEAHGGGTFLRQHGVEITTNEGKKAGFLDNRAGFVRALKHRYDLMNTWKVSPTPTSGAVNINEVYGGQKVLAVDIWPNSVQIFSTTFKDFKSDFVTTPLVTKGEKRRSMLNEHAYSVTVASKNPEAAFDFLTFMVSKEFQIQAFLKGLKAPNARPDVWGDARLYEQYPAYKKLQPIMQNIEPDFIVGNFRGAEFDAAFNQGYDQLELGKLQPDAAAEEIQKLTQAVLDKPPA